jgi:hypothetical protein
MRPSDSPVHPFPASIGVLRSPWSICLPWVTQRSAEQHVPSEHSTVSLCPGLPHGLAPSFFTFVPKAFWCFAATPGIARFPCYFNLAWYNFL